MEIYEEYFRKYDKITASKLVSKPGSSEHQWGLGVDLTSQSVVDKKRHTKAFFNRILELNQDQLDKLDNDLERKMDEKGNLFLRLSKEAAIEDEIEILDSGDSIHLKVKIAAFPAKKSIAIEKVREALHQ